MIPSILDTVIFIIDGQIGDVLELRMTVKVPSGMQERDLARPVIEVRDFTTHELLYDIFVFGEQVSVIPVGEEHRQPIKQLTEAERKQIERLIRRHINSSQIKITKTGTNSIRIEVPADDVPYVIGRKGKTITELEKKVGMKIDVKPMTASPRISKQPENQMLYADDAQIPVDIRFTKTHVVLSFPEHQSGMNIEVKIAKKVLFSGSIGKKGEIKIERSTSIAKDIVKLINKGETLYANPK